MELLPVGKDDHVESVTSFWKQSSQSLKIWNYGILERTFISCCLLSDASGKWRQWSEHWDSIQLTSKLRNWLQMCEFCYHETMKILREHSNFELLN